MDRRTFLAAVAGGAGVALAGCAGTVGSGTPTPEYEIGMAASAFRPSQYEASVGETVTWRNTNSRAHTVTAYENAVPEGAPYFASGGFENEKAARDAFWNGFAGALSTGDTFEYTFEVPGQYDYFCIPHERGGMVGSVVVEG